MKNHKKTTNKIVIFVCMEHFLFLQIDKKYKSFITNPRAI